MRGAGHVVADGLAVQAHLLDGVGQDLQARPGGAAGPAVRLLLLAGHVGVEVGLGARAGLGVPRSHARHALGAGGRHHVAVQREGRAHRGVEHLGVEADLLGLAAGQDGVGRVGEADEGVGVLVLDGAQHGREVFHAAGVALVFHQVDARALQRHLEGSVVLQAEEVVHVDAGHGADAVGLEHVHDGLAHGLGLLQEQEEVRKLHLHQAAAQRRGRKEGVAEAVGQRSHGEVGVAAPGRQHQVHLVAAHQLLVGAHHGLGVTAVVRADELDLAAHALHVQAAGSVLLLSPEQEVGLLAHLCTARPRARARHGVAHAHRRGLGHQAWRKGHGADSGGRALDDLAAGRGACAALHGSLRSGSVLRVRRGLASPQPG